MSVELNVLYVEDEADIREVVEFALEDEGFELVVCDSGKEALIKGSSIIPDLILIDVMMPEMDGPTTLSKLREMPHMLTVPVIFMTAKVQPAEVEEYLNLGAVGVIRKPFDAMTLADEIHRLMGTSGD